MGTPISCVRPTIFISLPEQDEVIEYPSEKIELFKTRIVLHGINIIVFGTFIFEILYLSFV